MYHYDNVLKHVTHYCSVGKLLATMTQNRNVVSQFSTTYPDFLSYDLKGIYIGANSNICCWNMHSNGF